MCSVSVKQVNFWDISTCLIFGLSRGKGDTLLIVNCKWGMLSWVIFISLLVVVYYDYFIDCGCVRIYWIFSMQYHYFIDCDCHTWTSHWCVRYVLFFFIWLYLFAHVCLFSVCIISWYATKGRKNVRVFDWIIVSCLSYVVATPTRSEFSFLIEFCELLVTQTPDNLNSR